ncbi:MAG: hypothetical protein J1F13_02510 [Prevotellaceae bacterium]|nr:hypothetical protein [Prevotellaceae bacterium]
MRVNKLIIIFAVIAIAAIVLICSIISFVSNDNTQNSVAQTAQTAQTDSISNISRQYNIITQSDTVASTDSIDIIHKKVHITSDSIIESIYLRNKNTGKEEKLFTVIPSDFYTWTLGYGKKFHEFPFDSIPIAQRIFVYKQVPLQIIVEGCWDSRNEYSFFLDVLSRKAWHVPSNNGYVGQTKEGYMVFQSFSYFFDPETESGGRYDFGQVFNNKGEMIDSIDFESFTTEEIIQYREKLRR